MKWIKSGKAKSKEECNYKEIDICLKEQFSNSCSKANHINMVLRLTKGNKATGKPIRYENRLKQGTTMKSRHR